MRFDDFSAINDFDARSERFTSRVADALRSMRQKLPVGEK
jgi:hypothetical protein